MKNQKGFSLIELLIVILIISIIAAISVPNMIAARRSANEGSALSGTRLLHGAEMIYSRTNGGGRFTDSLDNLLSAKIIDPTMGSGFKNGYQFALKIDPTARMSFTVGAVPAVTGGILKTGTRKFCIAAIGVLRYENDESLIGTNIQNDGDCNETNYYEMIQ